MLRSPRSRRSAAAFYCVAIGVIVGVCCMTHTCSVWVFDATPDIVPAILGLAGFLLATVAVLQDGRRARPRPADIPPDRAPPSSGGV